MTTRIQPPTSQPLPRTPAPKLSPAPTLQPLHPDELSTGQTGALRRKMQRDLNPSVPMQQQGSVVLSNTSTPTAATLATTAANGVGHSRPEMVVVEAMYNTSIQGNREAAFFAYANVQFVRAGLGQVSDQASLVKKIFSGEAITADKTGVMQALSPSYAAPGITILNALAKTPEGPNRKSVLTSTTAWIESHPRASQQQAFDAALSASTKLGGTQQEIRYRAVLALATVNLLDKPDPAFIGMLGLSPTSARALTAWSRNNITLPPPGGTTETDRNHHFWMHALNTADLISRGVDPAKAAEAVRFMGVAYEIMTTGATGLTENKGNASLKDLQVNNAGVDFALGVGGPSDAGPANEVRY